MTRKEESVVSVASTPEEVDEACAEAEEAWAFATRLFQPSRINRRGSRGRSRTNVLTKGKRNAKAKGKSLKAKAKKKTKAMKVPKPKKVTKTKKEPKARVPRPRITKPLMHPRTPKVSKVRVS